MKTFLDNHPNTKLAVKVLVLILWLTLATMYFALGGWWIILGVVNMLNAAFAWYDVSKAYQNT